MDTLSYILNKYNPPIPRHMPVEIPNVGRNDLGTLFAELGFKVGAEIGTERGRYARVLCAANPALHLYCIDTWRIYSFYRDYRDDQPKLDRYRAEWEANMAPYNAEPINKFSMDAVKDFADGSLDFVYIDANHELPFVVEDIFYWARKVRAGGIISGHDYYETKSVNSRCHVVPSVQAYTRAFWVRPWFLLGTKAMNPGEVRDRSRSWMWVKDERQP